MRAEWGRRQKAFNRRGRRGIAEHAKKFIHRIFLCVLCAILATSAVKLATEGHPYAQSGAPAESL